LTPKVLTPILKLSGAGGWAVMSKDKDESPFTKKTPYEEILKVPTDQIKEKVRKTEPPTDKSLLTSKDLFGDIIEDFGEHRTPQADSPGKAASPIPDSDTKSGVDTDPGRVDEPKSPHVEAVQGRIRSDTVPVDNLPEEKQHPASEFSLMDLAYSTLLQDDKLNRALQNLEPEEVSESSEEGVDYGQYLLLDRIATGGMAEVFRAKRKGVEGFEKIVAVKRILPHLSHNKDFIEMFIDEAKMVAGLSHPNIVQIFELGKIDETYFIAMEYVDGKDLRTILTEVREKGIVPDVDLAALVASKVGSALEYAHRQCDAEGRELRIVHRDVSPQNILISREGEVKLVDFGIAKAAIKAHHTDSGSLRGKLMYMSPEQAWGRPIDNRADIFSLGVVLFEMLTGRNLFIGDSEMSILERVRQANVLPPSNLNPAVPIELEAVATRALRKEAAERYQDASEMLVHLDTYLRRRPAVGSADLARFLRSHFES
jgi:tRNA A-37 threonylcarbamoyl transferase component Bud32